MKISLFKKASFRRAVLPTSIIAAMAMSGSASAFQIETNNPDIDVRWDNTFRYNAGWRTQDAGYAAEPIVAAKFKNSGDMITNRLDVLSEFDFVYKKDSGFRISGAGWYDTVYSSKTAPGAVAASTFSLTGGYPDETRRFYNGPSGEFLDAFVFTKLDVGNVTANIKLGQHNVYWGETVFSLVDGIADDQGQVDVRKAAATPGAEAKEIFKPLNQLSISAQITPELTLMGQYFMDWKPILLPLGGTFFSAVPFVTYNGNTQIVSAAGLAAVIPAGPFAGLSLGQVLQVVQGGGPGCVPG